MKYATIRHSTSRARDTYGYASVTLTDTTSGKVYRTCGGGYDMLGVVLADWLADTYQAQLKERLQGYDWQPYGNGGRLTAAREIYGAFRRADGSISIDGACGGSQNLAHLATQARRQGRICRRDYRRNQRKTQRQLREVENGNGTLHKMRN